MQDADELVGQGPQSAVVHVPCVPPDVAEITDARAGGDSRERPQVAGVGQPLATASRSKTTFDLRDAFVIG